MSTNKEKKNLDERIDDIRDIVQKMTKQTKETSEKLRLFAKKLREERKKIERKNNSPIEFYVKEKVNFEQFEKEVVQVFQFLGLTKEMSERKIEEIKGRIK